MDKTIALFASSRRNGNTGRLIDRVANAIAIEVVDLAERHISPYDYQHRNRQDDFEPLMEHVLGHKQIILASPVYWYCCSSPMKVFLDRISDFLDLPDLLDKGRQLRGKIGYVVCTSVCVDVPPAFISVFRDTFGYLGMEFGGYLHANCEVGYEEQQYERDVHNFIALLSRGADAA